MARMCDLTTVWNLETCLRIHITVADKAADMNALYSHHFNKEGNAEQFPFKGSEEMDTA